MEWGCVPVLLVVWHRVSSTVACLSLSGAGSWHWDGDLWEIFVVWYNVELVGLLWTSFLNFALLPQWHSPDAWLEHQEPVIQTGGKKWLSVVSHQHDIRHKPPCFSIFSLSYLLKQPARSPQDCGGFCWLGPSRAVSFSELPPLRLWGSSVTLLLLCSVLLCLL